MTFNCKCFKWTSKMYIRKNIMILSTELHRIRQTPRTTQPKVPKRVLFIFCIFRSALTCLNVIIRI